MHKLERCVRFDSLTQADQIENPEAIPAGQWLCAMVVASWACKEHGFAAIAFNQIPQDILGELGFEEKNPAIIYLSSHTAGKDQLLINPRIQVPGLDYSISIEGCGSIYDEREKRPNMFVRRPEVIVGEAWFWEKKMPAPVPARFVAGANTAPVIHHEDMHLKGKSALNEPDMLVDFRDVKNLREILKPYDTRTRWEILKMILENEFLVFDENNQKLLLVDGHGEVIKEEYN